MDKIEKISMNFTNDVHNMPVIESLTVKSRMTRFELATADEVRKLIINSPSKTCNLNPIRTELLKSCLDVLLVPITQMVNLSLISGVFPDIFKISHVMPLLKKPSISKNDMKNYRSVSNLNFVSKIIEYSKSNSFTSWKKRSIKSVSVSLQEISLYWNGLFILNMDEGRVTALTLLDLSAAFNTLDHSSITNLLSTWYGIDGIALDWFVSYLSDRKQKVKLMDCLSSPAKVACGVPQGSVLGPLLFTLYTTPLSCVIQRHNVKHHLYADDTQISFRTCLLGCH